MEPELSDAQLNQTLAERFKKLPRVVQNAITSADVQAHLRQLADTSKLHIDQWETLENDVMLTLLGFQEPEALADNLQKDLEVPEELAKSLAASVSSIVFEPIRAQLEKELGDQGAETAQAADIGQSRALEQATQKPPAVAAATPPAPAPAERAVRAPISSSYASSQASHERKTIEGDPYREPIA